MQRTSLGPRFTASPGMFLALNGNQVLLLHLAHFGDEHTKPAVLHLGGEIFLVGTGQVDVQLVILIALLNVRVHHATQDNKHITHLVFHNGVVLFQSKKRKTVQIKVPF